MQSDLLERFESRIARSDEGCWVWMSRKTPAGYGQFRLSRKRQVYAHRFAHEVWIGPIPEGFDVDHLCFNPSCVRPDHLEAVTPQENHRRRRGRSYRPRDLGDTCPHGHPRAEFMTTNTYGFHICVACRRISTRRARAGAS